MNIYIMAKYIKLYVLISLHCNITSFQIPKISNDVIAVSINTSAIRNVISINTIILQQKSLWK